MSFVDRVRIQLGLYSVPQAPRRAGGLGAQAVGKSPDPRGGAAPPARPSLKPAVESAKAAHAALPPAFQVRGDKPAWLALASACDEMWADFLTAQVSPEGVIPAPNPWNAARHREVECVYASKVLAPLKAWTVATYGQVRIAPERDARSKPFEALFEACQDYCHGNDELALSLVAALYVADKSNFAGPHWHRVIDYWQDPAIRTAWREVSPGSFERFRLADSGQAPSKSPKKAWTEGAGIVWLDGRADGAAEEPAARQSASGGPRVKLRIDPEDDGLADERRADAVDSALAAVHPNHIPRRSSSSG